jgi:hypothetical protein
MENQYSSACGTNLSNCLCHAARSGWSDVLKYYQHIPLNWTYIGTWAAMRGNLNCVKSIWFADSTTYDAAIRGNHIAILNYLKLRGMAPQRYMMTWASYGSLCAIKWLIQQNGLNLSYTDIHNAIVGGYPNIVKLWYAKGGKYDVDTLRDLYDLANTFNHHKIAKLFKKWLQI